MAKRKAWTWNDDDEDLEMKMSDDLNYASFDEEEDDVIALDRHSYGSRLEEGFNMLGWN